MLHEIEQMDEMRRKPNDLDLVTKWGVVVLIVTAALVFAYSLIHYAGRLDETRARLGELPANYRETMQGMVVAAGGTCRAVCDLGPADITPKQTTFNVVCGTADGIDACRTTQTYALTLAPTPQPSR